MNNRLTIQDVAVLIAGRTGKDKNSSERFLKEFIAVVSEGVYTEGSVKVKGLGTFKIIPVEKRESIHVNTGERFVIPAHYKFSFLPDKDLREQVNKPFSFFETTELKENVDFSDVEVMPDESEIKEAEDESVEEVMPDESPVKETSPIPEKKSFRSMQGILFSMFAVFLFAIGILLFQHMNRVRPGGRKKAVPIEKRDSTLTLARDPQTDIRADRKRNDTVRAGENMAVVGKTDVARTDMPQADVPRTEVPDSIPEATPPKVIARVRIEPGSRLTLIALKHYGHKLFWVYLYDYNKAVIKDPNNVPIGTVIEVPAPEIYGIDSHDRTALEKAAALQTEILTGR